MGQIIGAYNKRYSALAFERIERLGGEKILFDNLIVNGEENLRNQDRQKIYIANHLSHADYMITWYLFHKKKIKMPMIPAGENLNSWFLRLLHIDFGQTAGFFIDRDLIESNSNGSFSHKRDIHNAVNTILDKGQDLLFYPRGRRDYRGHVLEEFKTGILQACLSRERDLDIVPMVSAYDKRVEEDFFQTLEENRARKNLKYYFADISAFAIQMLRRTYAQVGNAYMNIGEPTKLTEIVQNAKTIEQKVTAVKQFSIQKIKRLYAEIQREIN